MGSGGTKPQVPFKCRTGFVSSRIPLEGPRLAKAEGKKLTRKLKAMKLSSRGNQGGFIFAAELL